LGLVSPSTHNFETPRGGGASSHLEKNYDGGTSNKNY
jgi:hypothetical protein